MLDKHFHQVIALHQSTEWQWDDLCKIAPLLPRGWYELSRLQPEDRIEFLHSYWLSKLSFATDEDGSLQRKLKHFFDNLDEIGIYLASGERKGFFDAHMVYSLKGEEGYFQGGPPADQLTVEALRKNFGHIQFPADYLAFLQIHDGFSKYTDTGLIKSREITQIYQRLQHLFSNDLLASPAGQRIDPADLIPFYESFGLHCYQCFYTGWHPKEEMGNIYFSEYDRTMSNFLEGHSGEENLAFASFIEWLIFYLENIEFSEKEKS